MGNYSFSNTPVLRYRRSRFDLSHGIKTSANVGDLVPFDVQEVYAGDTFKVSTVCVSRLSSQFFRPLMDNLFLDVYYFFVPSRLLYDKFVNVFGENNESAWANTQEYSVPVIEDAQGIYSKTVGDYMGLPIFDGIQGQDVSISAPISVLPFRAFAKIYNEWFRDQNNVAPMHIQTGELAESERFNNNEWSSNNYMGKLPKVSKFHDYFTSCLPAPQKGSAVDIPLALANDVPVYAGNIHNHEILSDMKFEGDGVNLATGNLPLYLQKTASSPYAGLFAGDPYSGSVSRLPVTPVNLWAETTAVNGSGISVNDLRFAFQYQKMLERDARSGTRYVEYLQGHFGVSAGDYRLQRSEFLGGRRSPLSVTQVTQTTGSDSDSAPLAQVGAYSLSNSRSRYVKGFVEHGYVIGVFCIRQFHTYQQGVERFWTRSHRTDYYDPVFANIGEQPVYKYELYGLDDGGSTAVPFGYNEAWADLRFRPNKITGQMRTGAPNSLDIWHLADHYANAPTLSKGFIEETDVNLNRAITVNSSQQDQFILDFYIQNIAYRSLPTYSVPSLIDHN